MMHFTDKQLEELVLGPQDILSDEAIPQVQDAQLVHLEECADCQRRLDSLSGEGKWLEDFVASAAEDTCDLDEADLSSSSSIVIAVDSSECDESVQCESIRLDFLDAPRHPELLGRLGRYDIERLIGMGGFGIVFKARDSELNRVVAVKVLAPHLRGSAAARRRFAREAQASAAVVHDHVVPIFDVVSGSETCYFVMQYIPGQSLQERVERQGPLPIEDVLRIATQMSAGLQAAHEQGLIHRDVKPGNILLEDSVDRVLISDFGLARAADDASLTRSGVITGTPHYMSPEQARGESIDVRSDLFSLGSVLYFMCTGRPPFRAPRMMAVLNRICHEHHRPLADVTRQVPWELSHIVDRLLAKSPDDRFATAEQTRQAFSQLLSDLQSGRVRLGSRPRRRRPRPSYFRFWPVVAAAALILMLTAGWAYRKGLRGPIEAPSPAETTAAGPPITFTFSTDDRQLAETWRNDQAKIRDAMSFMDQSLSEIESGTISSPVVSSTYCWNRAMQEIEWTLDKMEDSLGTSPQHTLERSLEE